MSNIDDKIEVENINTPGRVSRVDRAKFEAMREALMKVLTTTPPGMSNTEMKTALLPHLDPELFPGGEKSGWWLKCVQLDLEAKAVIKRADTKPLRFYKL